MIFLDDNFPQHKKVLDAGGDAGWLYVCAMGWLKRDQSEDGRLPKSALPFLSDRKNPEKLAARLCAVELWHDDGDAFVVHDYVTRNAKAIATSKKRKAAADARWAMQTACKTDANADAFASKNATHTVHSSQRTTTNDARAVDDVGFLAFWQAYPRKDDKGAARKAWKGALQKVGGDYGVLVAAAERYARSPNRTSSFTKLPATWLRAEAWANGDPAAPVELVTEADLLNRHHRAIANGAS